jgi:hypothetical protein
MLKTTNAATPPDNSFLAKSREEWRNWLAKVPRELHGRLADYFQEGVGATAP